MHQFKRFFLLGAILISLVIPLITFTSYVPTSELVQSTTLSNLDINSQNGANASLWTDVVPNVLWTIYGLGVFLFSLRFVYNLKQIALKIYNNPKQKHRQFTNVLLKDFVNPHTFFNYIFLNRTKFEQNQIPDEVLLHEQTHAKQKHAFDILIIEILQILFWFNPLIFLLKKDIKLNHEFLADQAVLEHGIDAISYQSLLLAFSSNAVSPQLANAINYSLIKKRFTIMKTKTSKNAIRIRSLILLPLLAILVYGFSSRNLVEIPVEYLNAPVNYENEIPNDISFQKSASREQMAEYNAIVKKLNAQPEDERIIKQKDVARIKYIYSIMSDKQKADAAPFPKLAPPPPKVKDNKEAKIAAKVIYVKEKEAMIQQKKAHVAELVVLKEKQKQQKLEYVQQKKEMQKLKLVKVAATEADKEAMKVKKLNYIKEKEAVKVAKLKHVKEKEAVNVAKLKYVKEKEAVKAEKIKYQKQKELAELKKVREIARADIPPPTSPLDHVVNMAKEGAIFYLEGKEISSDKAISVLKKSKSLNIQTHRDHTEQAKVYISKKPIKIKED